MIFEFIVIFILLFLIIGLVYQFMYDIYGLVLTLSLIFYVSYVGVRVYIWKKHRLISNNEPKKKENLEKKEKVLSEKEKVQIVDHDLESLKSFIEKNLKEGFKEEFVVQALLKQGWRKEKVNQALSLVKQNFSTRK